MPRSLSQAMSDLGGYAQSRHRRTLSDSDYQTIGNRVGYQGGDAIDDEMYRRAEAELDAMYGGQQQAPPPSGQQFHVTSAPPVTIGAGGVVTPQQTPPQPAQPFINQVTGQPLTATPPQNVGIFQPPAPVAPIQPAPPTPRQSSQATQDAQAQLAALQPSAPPAAAPPRPAPTPTPTPASNALEPAFLARLQEAMAPIDPASVANSPILQQQQDIYRVTRQRAAERERSQLAEQMGAQGLGDSGAMQSGVERINARRGFDEAAFNAGLVGDELNRQRDIQTQRTVPLLASLLQSEQGRALQRELGLTDAGLRGEALDLQRQLGLGDQGLRRDSLALQRALGLGDLGLRSDSLDLNRELGLGDLDLRRQGINLQGELGRGDLNLRNYLGRGQLGLGLLSSLLNNQQFNANLGLGYDRLGYDYATLMDAMNRNAILSLPWR